ncbi:MAG: carbohydrate ABC transporter permease [Alphaproteobacteria bacterium]
MPRPVGHAGWGRTALAGLVTAAYCLPLVAIVGYAFKTRNQVLAEADGFGAFLLDLVWFRPTLDNFTRIFVQPAMVGASIRDTEFYWYFVNSFAIVGAAVAAALLIGTPAAYGFSRFPPRGSGGLLIAILATRMLPPIVLAMPLFLLAGLAGVIGSYGAIVAVYVAFNLAFTIWMMKSFFDELPRDIADAARLDGSAEAAVFFRIVLPNVRGGLAATAVFALVLTWNELLYAMLLTDGDSRTVPAAMVIFMGPSGSADYGMMAAVVTLFLIPVVAVTYVLQGQLLRGVTFGTLRAG